MNHIYTTTKATILFVEVPEQTSGVHIVNGETDALMPYKQNGIFLNGPQLLPKGDWKFITLLKDAREEDAMTLVDDCPYFAKCWKKYDRTESIGKGATIYNPDVSCWTAIESLHSLANSLGVKGNAAVLVKVSV